MIAEKINYIHYNPVEEGLVYRPEDMYIVVPGITVEKKAYLIMLSF